MTHHTFLQSILENPDDEDRRLTYAAWLKEHGQSERAEFIRLQCKLACLPADDPQRPELEAREQQLLAGHEREWVGPLRQPVQGWKFHRGFVEDISLPAETFLQQAEAIFRTAPVQRVRLLEPRGTTASLAACPYLGRLIGLGLMAVFHPVREEGVRELLASPYLSRLRTLELMGNYIGHGGVRALAESPLLAQLDVLDLGLNGVNDDAVEALVASPYWHGVERLELHNNNITPAGARALAYAPTSARLASLSLGFNYGLGSEGCETLAASPYVNGLRQLSLTESWISDQGMQALMRSPYLRLNELYFDNNGCREAGLRALVASPQSLGLRVLHLNSNPVGEAGVRALAAAPRPLALTTLGLFNTGMGDAGAKALASSTSLENLRELELGVNGIGDDGVEALAASAGLPKLARVNLSMNPVTDEGAEALLASPHLTRLSTLYLAKTRISAPLRQRLQQRFGRSVCRFH